MLGRKIQSLRSKKRAFMQIRGARQVSEKAVDRAVVRDMDAFRSR